MGDVLLNYSRPARRIKLRWPIAGLASALIVLYAGHKVEPILRWRVPYLIAQHRCMTFAPPDDQVAYQEDAPQAPPLAGGNDGGLRWTTVTDPIGNRRAFYLTPEALRNSRDWETGCQPDASTGCCLFLHARRARGGEDRLVYVEMNYVFTDRNRITKIEFSSPEALDWDVIQPGSLFSHPRHLATGQWGDATFHIQMPRPLCIYSGQADPADASHFTFKYKLPARTGTIDGWLQPDDQVKFALR
jgi:hypothetical protein